MRSAEIEADIQVQYNGDEIGTTYLYGPFKNNVFVWKADIKNKEDEWLDALTESLGDTYKSTGVNTGDRRRD